MKKEIWNNKVLQYIELEENKLGKFAKAAVLSGAIAAAGAHTIDKIDRNENVGKAEKAMSGLSSDKYNLEKAKATIGKLSADKVNAKNTILKLSK